MKTKFLAATLLLLACAFSANAQFLPTKNSVTIDASYRKGINSLVEEFNTRPEYAMKVRWFADEHWAVRANLNLTSVFLTDHKFSKNAEDVEIKETEKNTEAIFLLSPGFEYHFTKWDRVSPYVGAGLSFGFGLGKNTQKTDQNKDFERESRPAALFGINAYTGFDVYICKGFYMGTEIQLGYNMGRSGRSKYSAKTEGETIEEKGNSVNTFSALKLLVVPSIKFGWRF